jgi:hypothetical protein
LLDGVGKGTWGTHKPRGARGASVLALVLCGTIPSMDTLYLIWDISVLIINESSIGAFLHSALLQLYPCYYGLHIIFSHTY